MSEKSYIEEALEPFCRLHKALAAFASTKELMDKAFKEFAEAPRSFVPNMLDVAQLLRQEGGGFNRELTEEVEAAYLEFARVMGMDTHETPPTKPRHLKST